MIIKEIKLLSDALWCSVKMDLNFFSSIQHFVRCLAEYDFSNLNQQNVQELVLSISKIDQFFEKYRYKSGSSGLYIEPSEISNNDDSVKRLKYLVLELGNLPIEKFQEEVASSKPPKTTKIPNNNTVFIGHGRSQLWARLQVFLKDELKIDTLSFESESHTSETIVNVLEGFLNKTSFAILIMTAEDETADGQIRARQNVIHEAGLFQGRLGFDRVVILKQNGVEEFSNIAGLQYIPFQDTNVEQAFYELQRKLKKSGLVK